LATLAGLLQIQNGRGTIVLASGAVHDARVATAALDPEAFGLGVLQRGLNVLLRMLGSQAWPRVGKSQRAPDRERLGDEPRVVGPRDEWQVLARRLDAAPRRPTRL
jgi:hypothetical protein